MSRWDELFTRMQRLESERLEAERRQRQAEQARIERDAWAEAALDSMWQAVMSEVEERSAELARSVGRQIEIVRHVRTQEASDGLAGLRILELKLGASIVYLYSHHAPGSDVHVHVAQWPAPDGTRRRHHRMISLPVCTLEPSGDSGWVLQRVSPNAGARSLGVEDIVYRAFELLVFSLERPDARPTSFRAVAELEPRSQKTVRQFPSD